MSPALSRRRRSTPLFDLARYHIIWQNAVGILLFFIAWQVARSAGALSAIPGPIEVFRAIPGEVAQDGYWMSWLSSTRRVLLGFIAAAAFAVPLGIWLGTSQRAREFGYPILEILRPIPPLAWLPLSILFWPNAELTMVFLTFIGAFFPIFINVLAGIHNIDIRYIQSARSLGATPHTLFWKVLVPGALPSMFTGLTISIAITWEVVIAAEMASGSNGLGYLTWNAYMSQSLTGIVIGMLSIGLAGLFSSILMAWVGRRAAPWRSHR